MINWIIKFLGGFTREEMRFETNQNQLLREQVIQLKGMNLLLNDFLKEERQRLAEIINPPKAEISPEELREKGQYFQPIQTTRPSFLQRRKEFERREHQMLMDSLNQEAKNA